MTRKPSPRRSDLLGTWPGWAKKLAQQYYTQTVSTFLLHGAVRDLQPLSGEGRKPHFAPLKSFLSQELFGGRDHVLFYDRSSGIRFAQPQTQADLLRSLAAYDTVYGTDYARALPRDPGRALQVLENFLRLRLSEGRSLALIIDFAESLAPQGELSHLSAEDRFVLATLEKWAHDPQFLAGDVSIVLLVENLADVSFRLSRNPYVAAIALPLPNEEERRAFVEVKLSEQNLAAVSELPLASLSQLSAGLSRLNLDRLLTEALEGGQRLSQAAFKEKKKEIIQAECHGLLEFIEPPHTLDAVSGHAPAKKRLRQAAHALRQGKRDVMPMGYLVSGPVGTGKTFLVNCFAGEVGVPCVKLLNFRSQWQGVTEANLEKMFNLLKALWPVAVMIDEADAFLGQRDASGDSGTSSRVFASIASFMGDTAYRGKILWFLLTCRPDLLPIDLKRQGRAEEHLSLFYPQSDAERDELFAAMVRKTGMKLSLPSFAGLLPPSSPPLSGADIEAVLVRARFRALAQGRDEVGKVDLEEVLKDFVPPSYPLEVELQNLVAVQECTSRELLPLAFQSLSRADVTRRIRELKVLLREH